MALALVLQGPPDPAWKAWLTWFCRSDDPPLLVLVGLCLAAAALGWLARRPRPDREAASTGTEDRA
ncbi:MAG: hypothetical protein R3B09_28525 [Nannocystaceae bacterium]